MEKTKLVRENKATIAGIVATPVRVSASGKMAGFSIPYTINYKKENEHTTWFNIKVFGGLIDEVTHFKKGDNVRVEGSIRQGEWTKKDGTKQFSIEVFASHCERVSETTNTPKPEQTATQKSLPEFDLGSDDFEVPF